MNPILLKLLHALVIGILISASISTLKPFSFYQEASRPKQLLIVAVTGGILAFMVNLFWPFPG